MSLIPINLQMRAVARVGKRNCLIGGDVDWCVEFILGNGVSLRVDGVKRGVHIIRVIDVSCNYARGLGVLQIWAGHGNLLFSNS